MRRSSKIERSNKRLQELEDIEFDVKIIAARAAVVKDEVLAYRNLVASLKVYHECLMKSFVVAKET